jgi:WD40 repeat protein
MSLLFHGERLLLAGYEDGSVDAFDLVAGRWTDRPPEAAADSKMHSEPVLGLLPLPVPRDRTGKARRGRQGATANCLSCGADGRICTFALPSAGAGPNFVPGPASKVIDAPPSETESRGLNQLAARQDGRLVAGASWTGFVHIYDAQKEFRLLVPIPASDAARRSGAGGGGVNTVAFADGLEKWWYLASGASDRRVTIWDLYGPK